MSFSGVFELLYKNDIPLNAKVVYDSEDWNTEVYVGRVFYNRKENEILLTKGDYTDVGKDWELLQ